MMKCSLAGLWILMAAAACTPKETTVRVNVSVKTNQGEPVSSASVVIDGKTLGETDNSGTFAGEVGLPVGAKKKLEVRKESDTYYFAPYYQSFAVGAGSPQDLAVTATLYFVPKPQPTVTPSPAPVNVATIAPAKVAPAPTLQAPAAPAPMPAPDLQSAQRAPVDETTSEEQLTAGLTEPLKKAEAPPTPSVPDAVKPPVIPLTEAPQAVNEAAVSSVAAEGADADVAKSAGYPRVVHSNQGSFVFTVHLMTGSAPLPDVDVALGEEGSTQLKAACTSNQRGRCVIRFTARPETPVTFVATKKGYKTVVIAVSVKTKDKLRITMEQGHTFDIYALTESYGHVFGLPKVQVFIAGKAAGETDQFGHYSHEYNGKTDDLVTVNLKPTNYLPESFETDFVASGQMTLVKYFTPAEPPPARMAVLKPVAAGNVEAETMTQLQGAFANAVSAAARKTLFSSAAFKEYLEAQFDQGARRLNKTPESLAHQGWQDTDLKASVDAVIVPTVVAGAQPTLELSVIDSKGTVLAAGKEELGGLGDSVALDRAVASISRKISRVFPFEGAVLSKEGDKVIINLGRALGRGIKIGDQLDVYGLQTEKLGRSQLHGKIATLTVRAVDDATAKCSVGGLVARATIERGDLVTLRARKAPEASGAMLKVTSSRSGTAVPIAQANVYLNDYWLGATDVAGRLYLDAKGTGTLKVIKQGFADYTQNVTMTSQSKLEAVLTKQAAFLRVDSKPSGATLRIDGKVIGKTPLASPVAVPAGFVKLELEGGEGYKPYSTVLELDQGTMELVGDEAIVLEPDYRATAQKLRAENKVAEALVVLNSIPKEHSDYLLGRHEAGEIYLTTMDQPAKAAEAFGIVTATEAVKTFADKRFIPSHIDEGVALFLTAERLAPDQPEAARAHYQKALEVLDNVVPYLRFVPAKEYAQAVHNVDYHRALCRHRLWVATQDPRLLAEAVRTWRTYLDGDARSIPVDGNTKSYIENAEVYLKQATASMNAARNVSRQ